MVPFAALALGRDCYAMDIDPLARMLIRVQCGSHRIKEVEAAGLLALKRAHVLRKDTARLSRWFRDRFDDQTKAFIRHWFPLHVRRGLLALWAAILETEPRRVRLPLKVAFSRVIIAKTAGTSHAIDLPHTRPHWDDEKEVPDPLVMFPLRLRALTRRLADRPKPLDGAALSLRSGDVRKLPYADASVDLILTSSPYANAIDYMRAHKFSLIWMGYSLSKLARIRSQMIGAEYGRLSLSEPRLSWLDKRLPSTPARVRRRIGVVRRFFHDMDTVVAGFKRVLKPGGACVLVLGESYVAGHVIDIPRLIAEIAETHGFVHVGTTYRTVNPLRRSLPFPRAGGKSGALAKRMKKEAIVTLVR